MSAVSLDELLSNFCLFCFLDKPLNYSLRACAGGFILRNLWRPSAFSEGTNERHSQSSSYVTHTHTPTRTPQLNPLGTDRVCSSSQNNNEVNKSNSEVWEDKIWKLSSIALWDKISAKGVKDIYSGFLICSCAPV